MAAVAAEWASRPVDVLVSDFDDPASANLDAVRPNGNVAVKTIVRSMRVHDYLLTRA